MKKLHLAASKDSLRPAMTYIQLKKNKVCVTNAHILAAFPDTEVFGFPVNEELYFSAEQWKKQRIEKAARIEREGNTFKAYDNKSNFIGMIEAMTPEQFTDKIGRFPEWEIVIPTSELLPIDSIGFDPEMYTSLVETVNASGFAAFSLEFRGKNKAIIAKPQNPELTAATLLLMPVMA